MVHARHRQEARQMTGSEGNQVTCPINLCPEHAAFEGDARIIIRPYPQRIRRRVPARDVSERVPILMELDSEKIRRRNAAEGRAGKIASDVVRIRFVWILPTIGS